MVETKRDEVSLLDLWRILVEQKKIVAVVWAVCVVLGMGYAFLATPIYKTEAFMLPPSEKSIQPLNVRAMVDLEVNAVVGLEVNYQPEQVYRMFLQALRSRSDRRAFYEKHGVAEALNSNADSEIAFEEEFSRLLLVKQDVKKQELEGFSSLSFEGENAVLITQWVNTFVEETARSVSQSLVDDVMSKVDSLKRNTEDLIQSKKSLAVARRQDRIAALEEALRIALSMNEGDQDIKSKVRLRDVAVNTDELPLYMLSPNALKAEIKVLKNRKDDAPFIAGLRDLEERLAGLNQIHVKAQDVQVMTWDQHARVPEKPMKPKKVIIILLALLSGLILGSLTAFIRHTMIEDKNE